MSAPELPDGFFWDELGDMFTTRSSFARRHDTENLVVWEPANNIIYIWHRVDGWKDGPTATTREEAQAITVQLLYLGELAVGPEGD